MSWFAGLANKAEEMLNKVDQSAAVAFNQSGDEEKLTEVLSQGAPPYSQKAFNQPSVSASLSKDTKNTSLQQSSVNSRSVPSGMNNMAGSSPSGYLNQMSRSTYSVSQTKTVKSTKKDKDDELFEFLNSGTVETDKLSPKRDRKLMNVKQHSRQSSTSSTASSRGRKTPDAGLVLSNNGTNGEESNEETASSKPVSNADETDSTDQSPSDVPDDLVGNTDSSSGYHSNHEDDSNQQQQLSSLELENKLLKNEVASLNQEMRSVIDRAKEAQMELQRTKKQMASQSQQLAKTDQIIRELQAMDGDLREALQTKDAQLGVLRVRLDEADKALSSQKNMVDEYRLERDRILQDHTSASGVQNQVLDSLRSKIQEAEAKLSQEQEAHRHTQQEAMSRQSQLELEQRNLADSLREAERKLSEERSRITETSVHCKSAKSQAEAARQELIQYKDKAARILQSKDKLISSLKEGGGFTGAESAVSQAELEAARQERDMLREELQQSKMALENMRAELQDIEVQMQSDSDNAQDEIRSLQDQHLTEKRRREDAEQEMEKQKQELRYAHEEILKQKTAFQGRLQEREHDIEKLRTQLTTKSMSSTSQTELENRLHALTESLIQKQTMLEALGTEKNSLVLQLERMEKQYKDVQASVVRANATAVSMNEDEEVKHRLPFFMKESPADNKVTRKVKRAANEIDRFSSSYTCG